MFRHVAILLSAALPLVPASADVPAAPAVVAPASQPAPKVLQYLKAADFSPTSLLPAPPAKGSATEASELASLHALIASASAARMQQAKWDADHEDPAIFSDTLGLDLTKLPHTWALLKTVQSEANIAAGSSKKYFNRTRPWGVDTTIPNCEGPTNKPPVNSYPSGHATLGYSVGYVLAQLVPAKATAILGKADDYARSREYCGQHFASDTAASHVLGTLAAVRLMGDPRLADQFADARAELAARPAQAAN
jgi:acid phosphatase (class A)